MKILHTSDWHIGKRLFDKARFDEQTAVLDEIAGIAERENIDVVVVAGDVFDTYNPSADAERVFYRAAVRLAQNRIFVAVAGNHDDPDRLHAPQPIAEVNRVFLGDDFTGVKVDGVTGGKGFLKIEHNGEKLNLALVNYPSEARSKEKFESYTELVRASVAAACDAAFGDGFDMLVAHLFMASGAVGDERTLGAAVLVPPDVIPKCDYCALGHIHKPMPVSKSQNIFYSGSVLNYRFGETAGKSVRIVDTSDGSVQVVPLKQGKPLVTVEAHSAQDAIEKLQAAGDAFVRVVYDGKPLEAAETAAIRACPAFCDIEMHLVTEIAPTAGRILLNPVDLFEQFYKEKKGGEASEKLKDLFIHFMNDA